MTVDDKMSDDPPAKVIHDQSSMTYWWPKLRDLPVQTPETKRVEAEMLPYDDSDTPLMVPTAELEGLKNAVGDVGGPPAFFRSDHTSDKHRMTEASKITEDTREYLKRQRWGVVEKHVRSMGMPSATCYYVREWLDLYHKFTAFEGCPIAAELRFYLKDNEVYETAFYWPTESITRPDTDEWEDAYEGVRETALARAVDAREKARTVADAFDGYWTVDFALTDGMEWHAIDMARGEISWHPEGMSRPDGCGDPRR